MALPSSGAMVRQSLGRIETTTFCTNGCQVSFGCHVGGSPVLDPAPCQANCLKGLWDERITAPPDQSQVVPVGTSSTVNRCRARLLWKSDVKPVDGSAGAGSRDGSGG